MPRKYYPLTPSQKIHFKPIIEFGTQQVANISICMTLQASLDFGLLKKCIQLEYERYECLRIRFTKVDSNGEVRQYVVSHDDRDIDYENLSWLSGDDAYHRMEEWSRIPFDGDNIPMNVIKMISLPGGYNGLYIKIDHRLMDSCGAIVMVNDIMELYCHYKFGTPYPEDMASFTDMVERDLKKSTDEKRVSKDRMYWQNVLEEMGEPIYSDIQGQRILQESRRLHNDKSLRAADQEINNLSVATKNYHLDAEPTQNLLDFCMNNHISMTNLILMGIRTYLSKANGGQTDISIRNYVSRRSTHAEWVSGGSRAMAYPCRTIIDPDTEFLDAVFMIQDVQNHVYRHCNYDPELLSDQMKEMFHTPPHTTYESVGLTYQPLPIRLKNPHLENISVRSMWIPNGTSKQKIYLTVMHSANDLGLNFYFRYQTASLSEQDIELFYYYLMKIIFKGIAEPEMTVGEIIECI